MSAACTADGQHIHDATAPNRNAAVQYWYVVVVPEISCGVHQKIYPYYLRKQHQTDTLQPARLGLYIFYTWPSKQAYILLQILFQGFTVFKIQKRILNQTRIQLLVLGTLPAVSHILQSIVFNNIYQFFLYFLKKKFKWTGRECKSIRHLSSVSQSKYFGQVCTE